MEHFAFARALKLYDVFRRVYAASAKDKFCSRFNMSLERCKELLEEVTKLYKSAERSLGGPNSRLGQEGTTRTVSERRKAVQSSAGPGSRAGRQM